MKKLIFISAVSGVGKTTTIDYIKNNNLLDDYDIFDIDNLVNIHDYNSDEYNLFYEDAIKKAVILSKNNNIIIGSCINPTDINKITIPDGIEKIEMVLIYCSNGELRNRLKARDESRNCSSDEFINGQIEYQNYMLNHSELYSFKIDNTSLDVSEVAKIIINYLKNDTNNNTK